VFLYHAGVMKTFLYGIIIGGLQIAYGGKFLQTDPDSYIKIAYDLSRTLLWDKTRSFKFVGRVIYDAKWFHIATVRSYHDKI
jgi:hypothetical protein